MDRFACEPGRCRHALLYHAVLGDWERFHALGRGPAQDDADDALTYAVLGLEHNPDPVPGACEAVGANGSPMLTHALTKFLLQRADFHRAFALVRQCLERDKRDTPPLNLSAKYLAAAGETDAAIRTAAKSLECNPSQRDMDALVNALRRGERYPDQLYLSPVPKRFDVTFYIPAYNAAPYIQGAIEALTAQSYPLTNVLIVDDGSSDETASLAGEHPVELIRFSENRGLAAARNAAFRAATGDLLGTVDADVYADPDYTVHALTEFENASPLLAGVGGRLFEMHTDTPADHWRARILRQGWYPWRMYFAAPPPPGQTEEQDAVSCSLFFLTGCNTIYRPSAVLEIGGYDEKYHTNAEDFTMCHALRAANYHVAFTRYATVRHARRDTVRSVLKTAWNYGYWFRREGGAYSDPLALLANLDHNLSMACQMLSRDTEEGAFDCAYVDFLLTYVYLLLDLRAGVQEGILSIGQAARVQQEAMDLLKAYDMRHGGVLYERVRADCAAFCVEAPLDATGDCLPPDMHAPVCRFLAHLRNALERLSPPEYALLTRQE